jgi:hypothetical protein
MGAVHGTSPTAIGRMHDRTRLLAKRLSFVVGLVRCTQRIPAGGVGVAPKYVSS